MFKPQFSHRGLWRVGVYLRLSKEDNQTSKNGQKDESNSIANQRKIADEYLEKNTGKFVLVDYYIDDGISGTTSEREDFQRMLGDIEAGKIDCVIFKDLSRLSRNYSQAGYYLEEYFVKYQVRYITLMQPAIDSYEDSSLTNSMYIPMQNVFNDEWARATSIKVRTTFDNKRRKGEFIGAFAPYGYQKAPENKNRLVIDEETAPIVQLIFKMYADGNSLRQIANYLNEEGILSPAAYKKIKGFKHNMSNCDEIGLIWCIDTISHMLRNEIYIGTMVQGRQMVCSYKVKDRVTMRPEDWIKCENTHESLIDKELFSTVEKMLGKNKRTTSNGGPSLFAGFLKCADCGRSLVRHTSKTHINYRCSTYNKKGKQYCSPHTVSEQQLQETITTDIKTRIEYVAEIERLANEIGTTSGVKRHPLSLRTICLEKQQQLNKIKTYKQNLYETWQDGDISREEYLDMKENYECQAEDLKKEIGKLEKQAEKIENAPTRIDPILEHFLKYQQINQLDRGVLTELVDIIIVHEEKLIEIKYSYEDEINSLLQTIEIQQKKLREDKKSVVG